MAVGGGETPHTTAAATALTDALAAQEAFARASSASNAKVQTQGALDAILSQESPKVAAADNALRVLDLRQQANDSDAIAATAQAASDAKKLTDTRALLELEIEIANARARGDETAATAAQRRLDYLKSYQNIWKKTGDAALADRYANATASPLEKAATAAAARPTADRSAEETAKATRDTAKNTERIAKAITTPAQKGELTF